MDDNRFASTIFN